MTRFPSSSSGDASNARVVDVLNGLLEAELASVFRLLEDGSVYLPRASAELRAPLEEMVKAEKRRVAAIAEHVLAHGGSPLPRTIRPEEQYLAYLNVRFLVPKLAEAKRLMIERYKNASSALANASQDIVTLISQHLAQHKTDLSVLESAIARSMGK